MSKIKYIFLLLLLVFWQVLSLTALYPQHKIPSPLEILFAMQELLISGLPVGSNLAAHCCYSLLRVMCGFLLAAVIAIPCGIVTGWSRALREMLTPLISMTTYHKDT